MLDRKGSSIQGREANLTTYNNFLMQRYCHDQLELHTADIFASLCKSIKNEDSEKEASLALRGMALRVPCLR